MTDKQFCILFGEALDTSDRDAFVDDWALSSILNEGEDGGIPESRLDDLGEIWDVAHMTIRNIRECAGLSQAKFATHFCIPARTIEDWERGARKCPDYLRLLLAQAVGAYQRR